MSNGEYHTPGPFYIDRGTVAFPDQGHEVIRRRNEPNRPIAVCVTWATDRAERDELVGLLNKGTHFDALLSFIRDDLCDIGDVLGHDHPVEQQRRQLIAELENPMETDDGKPPPTENS